ncbi:MAG: FAD binding domain-containing protein [Pirellulaceae bacterium]|nr:FAD binding domain-containing protein [Pirellulaceae bacterium]
MKNFEFAQPKTEAEALELLSSQPGHTELLAGGTDLVGLMKRMVVTPQRVVDIGRIDSIRTVDRDPLGNLWIGTGVNLDDFLGSSLTDPYPAVKHAIQGINSLQLQAQGTLGGELLRRPQCWYFRDGHGLLADGGRTVVQGDNRFHAILGNRGAAKFVNASRLAPALISLQAQVRILGPNPEDESIVSLERLFQTPGSETERENSLLPNQLLTHLILPQDQGELSASYEVRQGEGPDAPLAAAAATFAVAAGVVQHARIVMGQVAPTPWISAEAEAVLTGQPVNQETARQAGLAAVRDAMPLSENEYKVQLAQVAVQRAILRAAGLDTGGF